MDQVTLSVEKLEDITQRLSELYRLELETEMRKILGEKLFVVSLDSYEESPIEDHFFPVGYEQWHIGSIFPFRKLAFGGRPDLAPDLDPFFRCMKEVLERRGYSVKYEPKSPETIIDELRKQGEYTSPKT